MKRKNLNRLVAILLAALFGLFLTYNSLTSSDFVRGIYGQPNTAHWANFDSLHPNRVWNYSYTWGGVGSLEEYLTGAGQWNIQPFLRLDTVEFDTFYLEYYSCGQHHIYQAEWDYEFSSGQILGDAQYFYHFYHAQDSNDPVIGDCVIVNPGNIGAWKCTEAEDSAGVMLYGPYETLRTLLEGNDNGTWGGQKVWPNTAVDDSFRSIIRVMADLEGLSSSDTVFYWQLLVTSKELGTDTLARSHVTAGDFGGVSYPNWKQFDFSYTIPNAGFFPFYTVEWMDKCDFWVDWIEFYDMNRGRYLFTDQDTRDSVLGLIAYPCDSIEEEYPNVLAGWKQSDEPPRSAFDAHGVVSQYLKERIKSKPVASFCACR